MRTMSAYFLILFGSLIIVKASELPILIAMKNEMQRTMDGLSKQAAKEFAKSQICLFIFYLQESISILAKILLYHQVSFRFYRILIEFWTYLLTS